MKSDYLSLWYTQFRKLRASKGSDLLLCNDTDFDLHLIILYKLHWRLPFHSILVTRRPYLGHDNWRLRYMFFSHYKVLLTIRYSWKRLRKRCSKNLIKFSQVYISFVLQYVHCFEKKNTYWLKESWKTRLSKRLKCTIVCTRLLKSFWQLEKLDTPYKIVLSTPMMNSISLLIWKSNDWFEQLNRKTAQFENNPNDCFLIFRCFTYHLNKYEYRFIASFNKALTSSNQSSNTSF